MSGTNDSRTRNFGDNGSCVAGGAVGICVAFTLGSKLASKSGSDDGVGGAVSSAGCDDCKHFLTVNTVK